MNCPVSTLWIGESLTWIEQLCLASFRDKGHPVTVYSYAPVAGIPDGIKTGDAREIFSPDPRILNNTPPSYVADAFRVHLLDKTDHTWIDVYILCMQPLDDSRYLFCWTRWNAEINNCIMRLQKASRTLKRMLHFTSDPYPASNFIKLEHRDVLAAFSDPVERFIKQSQLLRTSIGPKMFHGVLKRSGEIVHAKHADVLSPVPWQFLSVLFNPHGGAEGWITKDTQAIHLWGFMLRQHRRLPLHPDSFIGQIAQRHPDIAVPFETTS